MLKLILKVPLVFGLTWGSPPSSSFFSPVRNYSATAQSTSKILNSLSPIKIYTSLNHPSKKIKMLNDLTGQGGIMLFLNKNSSLYAIEGSGNLAGYLQDLFNKEMLKLLADIKVPKAIQKKTKIQLKTHYQGLLKSDWKDYDLYLLEAWDSNKAPFGVDLKKRLVAYHTKYQPKLNLFRYVSLANGEVEEAYQWNRFKTEEQLLTASQKKATLKPLLTYRIDNKSPLDKLKGKIWYENKNKAGVYRWINRNTKNHYIGSTSNLGQVLYALQLDKITSDSKDYLLNQALKADGLTNFTLQILAYCQPEELTEKEAYYLQLYQPEYNQIIPWGPGEDKPAEQPIIESSLAKLPTSMIEYNSFDKQLVLFQPPKQSLITSNHSQSLSLMLFKVKPVHLLIRERPVPIVKVKPKKTWILSEATRLKQSLARQQRTQQPHPGFSVQVYDKITNKTTLYASLSEASLALNINKQAISNYLINKQTKPYKKRYIFTKL